MKITDILEIPDIAQLKIHFAIGQHNRREPYNAFLNGEFDAWQAHQRKRNFNRQYILSLIYYGHDEWLFAGIYEQTGYDMDGVDYIYRTGLTENSAEFIGRLIVHYNKKHRASYNLAEKYVYDILERESYWKDVVMSREFGYNNN